MDFLRLFIYLFDRDKQPARELTQSGEVGEEEAGSQWSREPDDGAQSQDLGSPPEAKADTY